MCTVWAGRADLPHIYTLTIYLHTTKRATLSRKCSCCVPGHRRSNTIILRNPTQDRGMCGTSSASMLRMNKVGTCKAEQILRYVSCLLSTGRAAADNTQARSPARHGRGGRGIGPPPRVGHAEGGRRHAATPTWPTGRPYQDGHGSRHAAGAHGHAFVLRTMNSPPRKSSSMAMRSLALRRTGSGKDREAIWKRSGSDRGAIGPSV